MATDPGGELRLDPATLPELRRAVRRALDQLSTVRDGAVDWPLAAPVMADEASVRFRAEFDAAAEGGARAVREYHARLRGALARLDEIQRAYHGHERDTAADLGRAGPPAGAGR